MSRTSTYWWSDNDIKYLIDHYLTQNYAEIAQQIGKSEKSTATKAQRLGLIKQQQPRYKINQRCFDTVNKDIAYILGFIITDGCVSNNRLEIHVQRSDKYILEAIRNKLDKKIPILDHEFISKHNNQIYLSSRLLLNSIQICNRLRDFGIVLRKTGIENMKNIPSKYRYHYLRGVLDGDGSIYLTKKNHLRFSICCSNKQFLVKLRRFTFPNYGYLTSCMNGQNLLYKWNVNKQSHIQEIYSKIYKNCGTLFLKRKKQILDHKFQ